MFSCSPDEGSLGKMDVAPEELVEGIAFRIEHDASNPNIIYLTSLMDSKYKPQWEHPQGRSQSRTVTLKIPFEGTYQVKFGIQTRGGVVYGAPATFTIDDFYADFVNHELWTFLTGGVGESKVWIHDNGEYGLAAGEMDYADPATTVEWANFSPNWSPGKGHTGDNNIWNSTMTFSLDGGATVDVHNVSTEGTTDESGTFMLDVDNHTLTLTDAKIMHTQGWDFKTTNWSTSLRILKLTENQLQVAVFRELVSGESEWWMIWNYVSKEYADNYVPAGDPETPYVGEANEDLTTTTTTKKTWKLSTNTPYNWTDLTGNLLNNWTSPADYIATGWAPYDEAMIANVSLTLQKTNATGGTYEFKDGGGNPVSGTYSVEADNNNIVFDKDIAFSISGWVSLATSSAVNYEKKLRIIKTEADAFGTITKLWLGQRSADKNEYMVFAFEPSGVSGPSDPAAAWKNALAGKTFKPDVNWFIDWVGFPSDFSGGWTSATTFGEDYTSNGWVWTEATRAVAESASLTFRLEGNDLKVDLSQLKDGSPFTATGDVIIDVEEGILNINIPLVDYTGSPGAWLNTSNPKSVSGSVNDWYFVSHGGSTLANIDTNGLWLGVVSNSIAGGDDKDEVLIFHYLVEP